MTNVVTRDQFDAISAAIEYTKDRLVKANQSASKIREKLRAIPDVPEDDDQFADARKEAKDALDALRNKIHDVLKIKLQEKEKMEKYLVVLNDMLQ